LGFAYLRKGMYPEAVTNVEKALALEKEERYLYLHRVDLAYVYAAAGRKDEARAMLKNLEKQEATGMDMGIGLFRIYFALGDKDRALAWMEKALEKKSESLLSLKCWPEFDRLRKDPRFADLVRRVGIPQ